MATAPFCLSPSLSPAVSQALVTTVQTYVQAEEPHLPTSYTWGLDTAKLQAHLNLSVQSGSSYDKNLDLKRQLGAEWTSKPGNRDKVADYYVRVWGGIKGNAPGKVSSYVAAISKGASLPFDGIASWSKVATAANPEEAAIFDARVSVSLNALQVLAAGPDAAYFPSLPSQNKVIKAISPLLKAGGQRRGWISVPKEETYAAYLNLLSRASAGMPGALRIARAEMILFANAEALAAAVHPQLP